MPRTPGATRPWRTRRRCRRSSTRNSRAAWIRTSRRCPVYDRGYWYYTRFEAGKDYPVYARRKGTLDAPEQVMLDGNQRALGHEFFIIGSTRVSPDGKLLAWTEDTVGRWQYTLKVRNLESGSDAAGCRDQRGTGFRLGRR